ncbi:hypothetical protein ARTHRO9AX_220514 [Arthrobacter sp. 9AX]|nr:hypothetical protein ARTHRO9AX_220514 [Arthrobacter sp. 9AX]
MSTKSSTRNRNGGSGVRGNCFDTGGSELGPGPAKQGGSYAAQGILPLGGMAATERTDACGLSPKRLVFRG